MELHTEKNLVRATEEGNLYDYIAEHYYEMSRYELKEVLLASLEVIIDARIPNYKLVEELGNRDYGTEDEE